MNSFHFAASLRRIRLLRRSISMFRPWSLIRVLVLDGLKRTKRRLDEHYSSEVALLIQTASKGDFSTDWAASNASLWLWIRDKHFVETPQRILEIGSWEGYSSLLLLETFPSAHITCVDTWLGGDEHQGNFNFEEIEARFDLNMSPQSLRITKQKCSSASYFSMPYSEKFDLIYVDGSHRSDDVLRDAIGAFDRLKCQGILMFDDFLWSNGDDASADPAAAIAAFVQLKAKKVSVLHAGWQVILRKNC